MWPVLAGFVGRQKFAPKKVPSKPTCEEQHVGLDVNHHFEPLGLVLKQATLLAVESDVNGAIRCFLLVCGGLFVAI